MSDTMERPAEGLDYSKTLYLPRTDFPMRAGLPKREPEIVARWQADDLYRQLREDAAGRPLYVLHDGPPYANGHLHIGHALNKILKDTINRSFQMRGRDANYVPGWDCHGLPIEWKIEEQYRAKGRDKDDVPVVEFRRECRDFASHWVDVQTQEFQRLGVVGDFDDPYLTMAYDAEATIAAELMKFARTGQLYRGSKPIMWSVVERTALAEAEVEYQTYESDTVWVAFPIAGLPAPVETAFDAPPQITHSNRKLTDASVVIWTTTPWTLPGNRCVCYSLAVRYGLYEVASAQNEFGPQPGARYVLADKLADECARAAKIELRRVADVQNSDLEGMVLDHPLKHLGYDFAVPMLEGDHVTDEAGTGFVHTAPGHGGEDFENWVAKRDTVEAMGISSAIPFTVDDAGYYTADAPGFGPEAEGGPARVIDDRGKKGDANPRVIAALIEADNLFARGRLRHDYPHSWRSKKPVIFRNTPQWFVHMDRPIPAGGNDATLRELALDAIDHTRFVPAKGQARLRGMIEGRPDWVLSRQRAWGVPITVFRHAETGRIAPGPDFERSDELVERIIAAFEEEGADAWYMQGARERFLGGLVDDVSAWEQVTDILDVWFDSGSTHAFCLEKRSDLKWPADLYLEGSDQHRGWFHSSLLEACGTRGRAPYEAVLTHGFTMAEDGRKMSKSLGNQVAPQDVIKQYGADILRLWVACVDYAEDQRIGPEIIKTVVDSYRRIRNTFRWLLGALAHDEGREVAVTDMPELERLMLHRLAELDALVRESYDAFDFKRISSALVNFATLELSAFYFDVRKDALYCDAPSSTRRHASLFVLNRVFDCLTAWLAPVLCFTTEEAWAMRGNDRSVHLRQFPDVPDDWRDAALAARWSKVRAVRRVVLGALEVERKAGTIGKSLEAAPRVFVSADLADAVRGVDLAEVAITSDLALEVGEGPTDAFRLAEVPGVAVVFERAEGRRCARSWIVSPAVGSDPEFPDVTPRDADALRELRSLGRLDAAA